MHALVIKHAITLFNLVLFALVPYTGVTLFYTLVSSRLEIVPAVNQVINSAAGGSAGAMAAAVTRTANTLAAKDYQVIGQRNLFGSHASAAAPQPLAEPIENLEKTSLQVTLRGTVTGPPHEALAVIEIPRSPGHQVFRIGDMVLHATLIMILREKVVLEVEGKKEVLEIDMARKPGSTPAPLAPLAALPAPAAAPEQQVEVQLTRTDVEQATQNLNQLMRQVRVRPNFSEGRPDGFSINGIAPDSFFTQAGLQNGDVIYGVDGEVIQTMDDALKFYSRLQNASQFSLDVRRQGRIMSLNFQIQ